MHIHSTSAAIVHATWSAMRAGQTTREPEKAAEQADAADASTAQDARVDETPSSDETVVPRGAAASKDELSLDDLRVVQRLRQRDQEVRAHEMAHVSAGGQYVTSSPAYSYETGPDGQRYAVGGEVGIDASAIPGDPEATLQKAQAVMRAALAPAEPSAQDQRVAAAAKSMASEALIALAAIGAEASANPASQGLRTGSSESSAWQETHHTSAEEIAQSAAGATDREASGRSRLQLERRIANFFAGPKAGLEVQA